MPLCLTLKAGDRVLIGPDMWVEVKEKAGAYVKLSFMAPPDVRIFREKAINKILKVVEPIEEIHDERPRD